MGLNTTRILDDLTNYVVWRERGVYPQERGFKEIQSEFLERARAKARRIFEDLSSFGASFFNLESEEYPSLLLQVQKPPYGIFCIGDCGVLKRKMISIVGTRRSSGYGESLARKFARELAQDFVVVSGMAYGIDSKAHEGAMETGKTVAVLASGVDIPTPKGNTQLYKRIIENGCVISPYMLGERALKHRFVERNALIAGMSLGTLVVEAPRKSGALITASLAVEFGRDVFAIPGDVGKYRSEGTNRLIKFGALAVTDPEDILSYYKIERVKEKEPSDPVYELVKSGLGYPEDISKKLGVPIENVLSRLSELEIEGLVYRDVDQQYRIL